MTKKTIKPQNVTFKDLEVGFGHDMGGVSGTMYFENTKVASFYADGWSGMIDDITFYSEKYKAEIIAYQKEKESEVLFQTPDMFINSAIMHAEEMKLIEKKVKKDISKFKKEKNIQDKETIGAIIFLNEDSYRVSLHNKVAKAMTPEYLEVEKNKAKEHPYYLESDEVYLLKYTSPRKTERYEIEIK